MRWKRKVSKHAEEVVAEMQAERKDDERLREDVALRQRDIQRRLNLVMTQARILKGRT